MERDMSMPQYRVTAPDKEYSRKTLGVQFNKGQAFLTSDTVNEKYLKRSVDETAVTFLQDWQGYQVVGLTPEAKEYIAAWKETVAAAEPATSGVMAFVKPAPKLKKNAATRNEETYKVAE